MPVPNISSVEVYRLTDEQVKRLLENIKSAAEKNAYRSGRDKLSSALGLGLESFELESIEAAARYRSPDPIFERGLANIFLATQALGEISRIEWEALTDPWTELFD